MLTVRCSTDDSILFIQELVSKISKIIVDAVVMSLLFCLLTVSSVP